MDDEADRSVDRYGRRVTGEPLVAATASGPLDGVRLAVKDLYTVAGHRRGAGNPGYLAEQRPAARHAAAVATLLAAGAEVAALVQTDEFAFGLTGRNAHYGAPENAAAPGRLPGGSSSGSAAVVAAGLADVGLGSDTGGSVRVPASWCGLFGLRTTHGLVDVEGLLPLAPSFDTVGWLTRTGDLLDRVAAVLVPAAAGPDLAAIRAVVLAEDALAAADGEVADAVRAAASRVAAAAGLPLMGGPLMGGPLVGGDLASAPERAAWADAMRVRQGAEAWAVHGPWIQAHPGGLGADVAGRFAAGSRVSQAEAAAAADVLADARSVLRRRVPPGVLVLLPATPLTAPARDATDAELDVVRRAVLELTGLASVGGLPALAVPAGPVGGRPVGLSVLAAPGSDRALTALATRLDGGTR